ARDESDRTAPRGARGAVLGVRLQGRARLPDLPGLHDEAPRDVHVLRQTARAGVAGVPVLRDTGDVRRARSVAAEDAAPAPLFVELLARKLESRGRWPSSAL